MSSLGARRRSERELDGHELPGVFAVAVLDGVDDRFADGNADPVDRVLVEAAELRHAVADHLDEVQHVEVAVNLQSDRAAARQHAGVASPAPNRSARGRNDGIGGLDAHAGGEHSKPDLAWSANRDSPVDCTRGPPQGRTTANVIVRNMSHVSADAATIRPAARAAGRVRVPGDKSISHRYAMLAALGRRVVPHSRHI